VPESDAAGSGTVRADALGIGSEGELEIVWVDAWVDEMLGVEMGIASAAESVRV
jgi:hypothetical protein